MPSAEESSRAAQLQAQLERKFQTYLDKSVPHVSQRWSAFACVALVYLVRAYFLKGYYIVTYGLGIYNLNLLIGFMTPQMDMTEDGPSLPTSGNEEFKPFVRRLPEFKFWYRSAKSVCVAFCMTFLPRVRPPRVLAHTAHVLHHALVHDDEATGEAHAKV